MNNPLSLNFNRFSSYLLELDEIVFFEWLVFKQISFGIGNPFYHSKQKIEEETKLARRRQEACVKLFERLGFLETELRYNKCAGANVKFYSVDFKALQNRAILSKIVDMNSPNFKAFLEFFKDIKKGCRNEMKDIMSVLNELYNDRVEMYNEGKLTDEKPDRMKNKTELPTNNAIIAALNKMLMRYSPTTLKQSFMAYSDSILKKEQNPKHIMANFISYDSSNDSYPVMEYYLTEFISCYSYSAR